MAGTLRKTKRKIPPDKRGRSAGVISGFARKLISLEVGECLESDDVGMRPSQASQCTYWGRKLGRRFVTRKIDAASWGVWRVE